MFQVLDFVCRHGQDISNSSLQGITSCSNCNGSRTTEPGIASSIPPGVSLNYIIIPCRRLSSVVLLLGMDEFLREADRGSQELNAKHFVPDVDSAPTRSSRPPCSSL